MRVDLLKLANVVQALVAARGQFEAAIVSMRNIGVSSTQGDELAISLLKQIHHLSVLIHLFRLLRNDTISCETHLVLQEPTIDSATEQLNQLILLVQDQGVNWLLSDKAELV